jgi:hypothetical protein
VGGARAERGRQGGSEASRRRAGAWEGEGEERSARAGPEGRPGAGGSGEHPRATHGARLRCGCDKRAAQQGQEPWLG